MLKREDAMDLVVKVTEHLICEHLTPEDVADGLVPEEMWLTIGHTKHTLHRSNDCYGRQCEEYVIQDIILEKAHRLFEAKDGEEVSFLNAEKTICIPAVVYFIDGGILLVLKTVIRNVYIAGGRETEKKVRPRKGSHVL